MAASVDGFHTYFGPTFQSLKSTADGVARVQAALDFAEATTSDTWEDATREQYVYLRMADALETQPTGRAARGKSPKGATVYSQRLYELEVAHAWGRGRLAT